MVAMLIEDLRAAGHDPATMVFTLDALHTQHRTATLLDDAGAGYVLTVKGNQPGLRTAVIGRLRDHDADRPSRSSRRSHGHGRTEERLIEVAPATGIDFPAATQIFRVTRYTGGLDRGDIEDELPDVLGSEALRFELQDHEARLQPVVELVFGDPFGEVEEIEDLVGRSVCLFHEPAQRALVPLYCAGA